MLVCCIPWKGKPVFCVNWPTAPSAVWIAFVRKSVWTREKICLHAFVRKSVWTHVRKSACTHLWENQVTFGHKRQMSLTVVTHNTYLSIPLHFLSNRVLYLQISLRLFENRVFCKADCVYLQNAGFVWWIMAQISLHNIATKLLLLQSQILGDHDINIWCYWL